MSARARTSAASMNRPDPCASQATAAATPTTSPRSLTSGPPLSPSSIGTDADMTRAPLPNSLPPLKYPSLSVSAWRTALTECAHSESTS